MELWTIFEEPRLVWYMRANPYVGKDVGHKAGEQGMYRPQDSLSHNKHWSSWGAMVKFYTQRKITLGAEYRLVDCETEQVCILVSCSWKFWERWLWWSQSIFSLWAAHQSHFKAFVMCEEDPMILFCLIWHYSHRNLSVEISRSPNNTF